MKVNIVLFICFFMLGCSEKPEYIKPCGSTFKTFNTLKFTASGIASYQHYVIFPNYSDSCLKNMEFRKLTKIYTDTCTQDIPVNSIIFLKSIKDTTFKFANLTFSHPVIIEHKLAAFSLDSNKIKGTFVWENDVSKFIKDKTP